jgi:ubiquinol-cytochrome c reductase cytochrome b subunit
MQSIKKRLNYQYLLNIMNAHVIDYPTPINLSYFWSFGFLSAFCLGVQLLTGIFLAMHYTPHVDLAFFSVEHIVRDVNNGWLIRYLHANGASMFFIVTYCHIFRGLYFGSYMNPRGPLWNSGVIIFLLMMGTGFMGYVLPWGQMSFWGATVITNLFSVIPVVGTTITEWLWGGFAVDNATLKRFFSLHYLMPFMIFGVVILHIWSLHVTGNNNPVGVSVKDKQDTVPFAPYYTVKDALSLVCFLILFAWFIFFNPNILGHTDNYIMADPLVTPAHIVPEWYFLPFYAILRSIPHKLGGVVAMVVAILCLAVMPFLMPRLQTRSFLLRPISRKLF